MRNSGLCFYRARWYDPHSGRFISEDPIGFNGGDINLYAYVRSNPLNFTDPKGTIIAEVVGGILVGEVALHLYLGYRAYGYFPDKIDGLGRKKHCYVNCMSMRIHNGNPLSPAIFSFGQEIPTIGVGMLRGELKNQLKESYGDLKADAYGMGTAFIISRSCQEQCAECSVK